MHLTVLFLAEVLLLNLLKGLFLIGYCIDSIAKDRTVQGTCFALKSLWLISLVPDQWEKGSNYSKT